MPGRHPDDDLLADLAADVLPLEQARAVEAHVLACDRCASLLSDAERVRGLLLADDAGPVPPEIWSRIEAALQAESPASPTSRAPRAEPAALPPSPPTPPAERRAHTTGPGGWDGANPLDDADWTTAVRPATAPHSAPRRGVPIGGVPRLSASRRNFREDRRRGPAPLLLAAAAAVVLMVAVGTVRIVQSGGGPTAAFDSSGAAAGASSEAAVAAPVGALITRSNKDYTSSTLADGARSLVHRSAVSKAGTAGGEGSSTDGATLAPEGRAAASLPSVTPDPKATDVTNPQRLTACLRALGATADSVVAVDLARYRGREAAVLVVRTATGYEVWVVERTCHPGDEGALAQTTLAG
jgi:hypothetical protein